MRLATTSRLPRSGNAALASGALIQAVVGAEFTLAGLDKLVDVDYATQFQGLVQGSPGATSGPLAGLIHALVIPNITVVAEVARFAELAGGMLLLLTALEVVRRRLQVPVGAAHEYEPLAALSSAAAALSLGVLSLSIYLLQGAPLPAINPGYAFSSPIAIELILVPIALGVAWMELARFFALRPQARADRSTGSEAESAS